MIKETFTKWGQTFQQIKREGNIAIYRRWDDDFTCFEVIRIRMAKERIIAGKTLPAGEYYPSNEDFGTYGWTYSNLEQAEIRFVELIKNASAEFAQC